MLRPQHPMDEGLWDWLQIATEGLSHRASARIATEVEAHYNEAVSSHLAEGRSLVGAQVMAIEELGDAKKAARRFRKKHLTEREVKQLTERQGIGSKRHSLITIVGSILIATALILSLCYTSQKEEYINSLIFFYLISNVWFDWIAVILVRAWFKRITIQQIVLMRSIHAAVSSAMIILSINWLRQHVTISIGTYCILFAITALDYARMREKLRNDTLSGQ
jgi:hypothetical protein